MKAVLDRIENGYAVMLIENNQAEFTVPVNQLPAGSSAGTWFSVSVVNDQITKLIIDQKTTLQKKQRAEQLRNKLNQMKKSSKYKR